MEPRLIFLDEIAWHDRSFEIPSHRGDTRLHDSLNRFGILDPLWVLKGGAKYAIVDGFKRLHWAKEKGVQAANAVIWPETLPRPEMWERRIEKKTFENSPNPAEKARIAEVLLEFYPDGKAPRHLLSALNIPQRKEILDRWVQLCAGGPALLELLGSGEVSDRAALEVARWMPESRAAILGLLRDLRCSASIQVEIIERINEISIREDKSHPEVLNDHFIQEIVSSAKLNHRQKTQALRELLARRRNPRLARRQSRFQQEIKELCLPPSLRIVPPPAFEGNAWKLEVIFSTDGELRDASSAASKLADSGRLKIILTN